jgi:predicted membrane-bound mannosyltransferase
MEKPVTQPSPNQRKTLLINPEFQINFLSYTIGMAAVIIAIFYGANVYFFWRFAQKGREAGLPPDHIFFKFIAQQARTMDYIFLATALFAFAFLLIYGFYLSNRVAGALWRLETHIRQLISTGQYKQLRFRKKDYFHEIAEAINELVDHFQKKP